MSAQQPQQPTQEQIRSARHHGFVDSVSGMSSERQEKLKTSYAAQDQRRERNVSQFYSSTIGSES